MSANILVASVAADSFPIYWSFEEKTFVKESLGTVFEILTKILRFA